MSAEGGGVRWIGLCMGWNWLIGISEVFLFVYLLVVDLKRSDVDVEQLVEKLGEVEIFVSRRNKWSCPGPPVGL